jgi:integrative and conjugative element protein (TIGR02256 family)
MLELRFSSKGGGLGLLIPSEHAERILGICAQSRGQETGGVLIGYYNEERDLAIVTSITGPPPDSEQGRSWFHRGVSGLQQLLDHMWYRNRRYYLGEWHFHPNSTSVPSSTDRSQLKDIANTTHYQCPEPLLVIIGGDPAKVWEVSTTLFRKIGDPISLHRKQIDTPS